ncbi:MAG: CPBP family intramembrane glutamic endopeptidase [Flavobacteriaceae bacterium]
MFIQQALKGKNDWWRTLVVCLPFIGIFGLSFLIFFALSPDEYDQMVRQSSQLFEDKNVNLVLMLSQFGFLLGLLLVLFYFLHQRSIITLTTARAKIDFERIFFAFFLVLLVQVGLFAVSYSLDSSAIEWNFDASKFIPLLIISLLLFPVQIGFEEYFFRGYLMQQIGISTKSKWIPLIITSVLFGVVHSANPEVAEIGFKMMVFYIGTGLFMGILTLLDDGLELALGFHFANNFVAATLITSEISALQTDAVFKYTGEMDMTTMFSETVISMLIVYPLLLFIFWKKYKFRWNIR